MKSKSTLSRFLSIASSSLLAISYTHAATLTWDSNTGSAGVQEAGGTFTWAPGDLKFWDGSADVATTNDTSTDIAQFGNAGTLATVATVNVSTQSINGLIFGATTTTGYTLTASSVGQTLTIGGSGITMNSGAQAATLGGANLGVILGGTQIWTNNATANLNISGSTNLSGNPLTISGSGLTSFAATSASITGAGGLTYSGSGRLWFGAAGVATLSYSGDTNITGGGVLMYSANLSANSNININGGVLESYWTGGLTRNLGTGVTEVRITGGESGFSMNGSNGATFNLGASAIAWGSTNFNPAKFLLNSQYSQNNAALTFSTPLNLNSVSADRTIVANAGTSGTATATLSGAITNTAGTGGLVKEGAGNLILSNSGNTYTGNTTISAGTLSVAATGSLGNASNSLIFNGSGATLRATGTIVSPSTRSVTMTTTGIIDNNGLDISIAGNIGGAGGLAKNGAGTLTLSGTNSYGGTTVNAGTLAITKEAALNDGTAASWTAAKVNVKTGATFALNVDSAGSAGFSVTNLNTLLGNISVANTAAQGLQPSSILGLGTGTATGATFTQGNAITNSTGAFGGAIALEKRGAGSLVLDKANTYTGGTTITGGTLQLNDGGVILGSITNNGIFLVNKTGALTIGTDFPAIITGTGSLAAGGGSIITVSTPTALQNIALNTTGGGSFVLSGVTTPTFGGLSGATGNLATVISSGYPSVTNLTLNTPSGSTYTYGGVIANGLPGGMSVTKLGAGTQVLFGANTYTGTTFVNAGQLRVDFNQSVAAGGPATDLINSASALSMGGGIFNATVNSTGNSGQTFNGLSVTAGDNTIVPDNYSSTSRNIRITLGSITQTIGGTVAFYGPSGTTGANNGIVGTVTNNAFGIIGGWAVAGNPAATASWATNNGTNVVALGTTVTSTTAGTTAATYNNANIDVTTSAGLIGGVITPSTLRFASAFATPTVTLATGDNIIQSSGILVNGVVGNNLATITGGNLAGSSAGELVVYQGNTSNHLTIASLIKDNIVASKLVKSGGGRLTLTNTSNSFSGGVVLNGGTLNFDDARNIGGADNAGGSTVPITVNGNATLRTETNIANANLGTGTITLNSGAILTFAGNSRGIHTVGGAVTGSGGVTFTTGTFHGKLFLNSTANTFTGPITSSASTQDVANVTPFSLNSIADGVGYGNIILNGIINTGVDYGAGGTNGTGGGGAIVPLVLNNRQIIVTNNNGVLFNNSSNQAVTINTDLGFSGTGARSIQFGFATRAGSGISTFAGKLTDNTGGVFSPTFGGGTWILNNSANTFTGQTTISAGTLRLANLGAAEKSSGIRLDGGTLQLGTDTPFSSSQQITMAANSTTIVSDRATSGAGITQAFGNLLGTHNTMNFQKGALATGTTAAIQFASMTVGSGGGGTATLNPTTANLIITGTFAGVSNAGISTLKLDGTSQGNSIEGAILKGTRDTQNLSKDNTSIWLLNGTGSDYNGTTTVTNGTLATTAAVQGFGINLSGISIAAAGTLSLRNNSSVSFTNGTSAYNIANSASGATINVDRVTGTGTNILTVGNLTTTSTAGTWGLNFTGGNGVGLSAGALNTPVSTAAGVHTITNNISGGGSLTLASVFNQATTVASPDLIFTGTGTTTVTGAITQTLISMDLIKNGAGILRLNGTTTNTGLTSVNAGTLGGTGTIAGAVTVAAAGSLAPGVSSGTLSIGGVLNISAQANGGTGKLNFELGPIANSDKIALTGSGSLTIGGAFLDFSDFNFSALAGLQNGTYKLITSANPISGGLAGSGLSGSVGTGTGTLQITGNDVELLVSGVAAGSPYDTWATSKGLTGANNAKTDDPDNDGRNNLGEFAFNGNPLSGSDNGKVYMLTEDSNFDGDAIKELILTVAVRTGTLGFSGSPSPSANQAADGITYSIEGSLDLAAFPVTVNGVAPVTTGLPAAGAGYEYRSFSLDGSNGLTGKGFLRAKVTSP